MRVPDGQAVTLRHLESTQLVSLRHQDHLSQSHARWELKEQARLFWRENWEGDHKLCCHRAFAAYCHTLLIPLSHTPYSIVGRGQGLILTGTSEAAPWEGDIWAPRITTSQAVWNLKSNLALIHIYILSHNFPQYHLQIAAPPPVSPRPTCSSFLILTCFSNNVKKTAWEQKIQISSNLFSFLHKNRYFLWKHFPGLSGRNNSSFLQWSYCI